MDIDIAKIEEAILDAKWKLFMDSRTGWRVNLLYDCYIYIYNYKTPNNANITAFDNLKHIVGLKRFEDEYFSTRI